MCSRGVLYTALHSPLPQKDLMERLHNDSTKVKDLIARVGKDISAQPSHTVRIKSKKPQASKDPCLGPEAIQFLSRASMGDPSSHIAQQTLLAVFCFECSLTRAVAHFHVCVWKPPRGQHNRNNMFFMRPPSSLRTRPGSGTTPIFRATRA